MSPHSDRRQNDRHCTHVESAIGDIVEVPPPPGGGVFEHVALFVREGKEQLTHVTQAGRYGHGEIEAHPAESGRLRRVQQLRDHLDRGDPESDDRGENPQDADASDASKSGAKRVVMRPRSLPCAEQDVQARGDSGDYREMRVTAKKLETEGDPREEDPYGTPGSGHEAFGQEKHQRQNP